MMILRKSFLKCPLPINLQKSWYTFVWKEPTHRARYCDKWPLMFMTPRPGPPLALQLHAEHVVFVSVI